MILNDDHYILLITDIYIYIYHDIVDYHITITHHTYNDTR
jgi:hypothetical protein